MYKNIDYLAIDVDGTLINDDHQVSDNTLKELKRMLKLNILPIIITGRNINMIPQELSQINIPYFIGNNGAIIYDNQKGKELVSHTLDNKTVTKIINDLKNYDCHYSLATLETSYSTQEAVDSVQEFFSADYADYFKKSRTIVKNLNDIIENEDILKVNINFSDATLQKTLQEHFLSNYKDLNVTYSMNNNLEISHRSANKGEALKWLLNHLKLKSPKGFAIGDSHNDLSMFEVADYSVAVANAHPLLKEAADEVGPSNNDDAVFHILANIN